MEGENTWFTITPTIEHRKRPAVLGPKDVTPISRKLLVEQDMLESTHEHSYMNSLTISLSALLQGKLCRNFHENSLSPTPQLMDQNNILIMLHEQVSMWTI